MRLIRTIQPAAALPGILAALATNVIAMIVHPSIAGAIGAGGPRRLGLFPTR